MKHQSFWGRQMIVPTDEGKTWSIRSAVNVPRGVRAFDEHMIIERKDGSLWMLVRTRYGIGESVSTNRGKTWSDGLLLDERATISYPDGQQAPDGTIYITFCCTTLYN